MGKELELFEKHFGTRLEDITLDLSYTALALIKEAWFARAALSKPSWDDAPEWANYVAQDADGCWYWYEFKPKLLADTYTDTIGAYHPVEAIAGWQDTLEQRPEGE